MPWLLVLIGFYIIVDFIRDRRGINDVQEVDTASTEWFFRVLFSSNAGDKKWWFGYNVSTEANDTVALR